MRRDEPLDSALFEAGLIQYGRFATPRGPRPFQHQLGLLASYPHVLREAAQRLAVVVREVDRLLCPVDSVALAVAVSLETGIPLVIARGDGSAGPDDFMGAFDIGHPAALVALTWECIPAGLLAHARRFGLDIRFACALLELTPSALSVPADAVFALAQVTERLVAEKRLPAGQGRAVQHWLASGR
jgi:hypothetical protein